MSGRIESIDVAKGIAIICIIIGHLGFTGVDGVNWVWRAVAQFHVPTFFIIAGYFLSTKLSIRDFIHQKAKRLLIPYVLTCVVMLAVVVLWKYGAKTMDPVPFTGIKQFLAAAAYGAGTNAANLPDGIVQIGAIWFFEALFIGLVEVRICMMAGKYAAAPVIVLFLLATISAQGLWLPLNIQSGFVAGFYIYIGCVLRKYRAFEHLYSTPLFLALITVAVIAYYANIWVSPVQAYLGPFWLGLPVSVCSSVLVIMLSELITQRGGFFERGLAFFGVNSLAVLCMHLVILNGGLKWVLAQIGVPSAHNIMFFVLAALHLVACGLFAYLTTKFKPLSQIFRG